MVVEFGLGGWVCVWVNKVVILKENGHFYQTSGGKISKKMPMIGAGMPQKVPIIGAIFFKNPPKRTPLEYYLCMRRVASDQIFSKLFSTDRRTKFFFMMDMRPILFNSGTPIVPRA